MKTRLASLLVVAVATVVAVGCAHSSEAPPKKDEGPLVTPAQVPWKDMTGPQRGRYMKEVVMPKMRDVFVAYDAAHFKKPTCQTCHGPDARANDFKMPNPELPELPSSEAGFQAMREKHPEMSKFMLETVTPEMTTLLGMQPYDPAAPSPDAFGCGNCHVMKAD